MEIDWPLTAFVTIGLLAAMLACRLLVRTATVCLRAFRTALGRDHRGTRTSVNSVTFGADTRSSL
jgi:hypothetical protein